MTDFPALSYLDEQDETFSDLSDDFVELRGENYARFYIACKEQDDER